MIQDSKFIFSVVSSDAFLFWFTNGTLVHFVGTFVRIASIIISAVVLVTNRIAKICLKTVRRNKNKNKKCFIAQEWIEQYINKIIPKTLKDSDITHPEFTLVNNEEQDYL